MSINEKLAELFRCGMTILSPTLNTRVCYRIKTGKKLNIKNPNGFKEKLLKLKLDNYDRNPLVKKCADKYAVRDYVHAQLEESDCPDILNTLVAAYDSIEG